MHSLTRASASDGGHYAIAPIAFGLVQVCIGLREQIVTIAPCRPGTDASADRDVHIRNQGVPVKALESAADALASRDCRSQIRAGQGARELLAAIARDRVYRAAFVAQQLRGFAKHGISDCVAESVVDLLEAIQIEHGD